METMENTVAYTAPALQLNTTRGLLKYILLSIITCGIYGIVTLSDMSNDINIVASRYDGQKTNNFCLSTFVYAPLTLGIAAYCWNHKFCNRIGAELTRRGYDYKFNASTFWLWGILGSLIVVGPFIYCHKMFKAMNMICQSYNVYG